MSNVSVLQAGLACCGVESSSVDLVSGAWEQTESASKLSAAQHILVIAGTVTHALAPTVKSAYDALQEPKLLHMNLAGSLGLVQSNQASISFV